MSILVSDTKEHTARVKREILSHLTTKEKYKIIEDEIVNILDKLSMHAPNMGYDLIFDTDGYFKIMDTYGKEIKKYKSFEKAINYLLLTT